VERRCTRPKRRGMMGWYFMAYVLVLGKRGMIYNKQIRGIENIIVVLMCPAQTLGVTSTQLYTTNSKMDIDKIFHFFKTIIIIK